ncbi:MAG: adenosine deaminase, partial [Micrococcales bacterium]
CAAVAKTGRQIRTGQILDAMRHTDRSLEIAELAVRHRDNGVVGFDIAGPELGFPPANHKVAFDYLAAELMPVTVHAGEADGIDSIRDAIYSGRTLRLGHGARLAEDIGWTRSEGDTMFVELGPVAEWVHDRGLALELCPSSNLQTGVLSDMGLVNELGEHPFAALYDLGFKVTVSPDNRLMSNTSITNELEMLVDEFEYELEDIQQFQLNAAEATFQAHDDREELIEQILNGFAKFAK